MKLTAHPSLLVYWIVGEVRDRSCTSYSPSVSAIKVSHVTTPGRLSSEVVVHFFVFEEKSLVSKGARGKLRGQPDVRYVFQDTLELQREVRGGARPSLEKDCTFGNRLKLVVPGNCRVVSDKSACRWGRGEGEVERKHKGCDRTTVDVEATEVGEAIRLNCFRVIKELLLDGLLVDDILEKVDARLEVVFEEVVALGGLEACVG